MHIRWFQHGNEYLAKRTNGTPVLVHTPILIKSKSAHLGYIPKDALNDAAAKLPRIWYIMVNRFEAPRGGFQTIFILRDERYADMQFQDVSRLPAPYCTHLMIESNLDGYAVEEKYITQRKAAAIAFGWGKF